MYSSNDLYLNHPPLLSYIREDGPVYGGDGLWEWTVTDPAVFGERKSYGEVMEGLQKSPKAWKEFCGLNDRFKQEIVEFCMGLRGLNITYDPVFKKIFNPELAPERLEEFISLCLGEKLKIMSVLPNESWRLTEDSSLLVMDILMKMESGALVNVEIQRIGYLFPGQRCACYSSDLVMRQYMQVRREKKALNEAFSYKDIKKVYTIVLMEKSSKEFRDFPNDYLHHAKQTFNTGLTLDLLQEYILVPLDIFKSSHQNISSKLEAWLYFIASDKLDDIKMVLEAYPEFMEIYREVFQFRYDVKELTSMFSEALRILDRNTIQLMIEQQAEETERMSQELAEKRRELAASGKELDEKRKELAVSGKKLEEKRKELAASGKKLEEKRKELAASNKELEEKCRELADSTKELEEKRQELAASGKELEEKRRELAVSGKELEKYKKHAKEQEEEIRRLKSLLDKKG